MIISQRTGVHGALLANPRARRPRLRYHLAVHSRSSREELHVPLYRYIVSPPSPVLQRRLTTCPCSRKGQNGRHSRHSAQGLCLDLTKLSGRAFPDTRERIQLAGVDDDAIAEDYALTRIGREPAREKVMARLAMMPFFASDNEKALNMLTSRCVRDVSTDTG